MSIMHYYLYYCIVFPSLIDKVTFPDLCIRHGALYCVSEILYSLYCIERERGIQLVCAWVGWWRPCLMGFNWNRERLLSEEVMGRLQNIAQRVS